MAIREVYEDKNYSPFFSRDEKKAIRYVISIFIAILLLLLFLYILQQVPHWQVAKFGMTNPKDLAEMENSYRATLAQILGGVAIGIGFYYTWRRVTIAEKNLKVSQEGQITERFTRAIDQLGNEKMEIRLGGIYALERISKESEEDYWPIMEILTAYIREHSYVGNENKNLEAAKNRNEISEDIQAILAIIRRRKDPINIEESISFNLNRTDLRRANLEGTSLRWTNLSFANLSFANLEGANLRWTNLSFANLEGANLEGANLLQTKLNVANLKGANLMWADLTVAKE